MKVIQQKTIFSWLATCGLFSCLPFPIWALNHSAYDLISKEVSSLPEALEQGRTAISFRARAENVQQQNSSTGRAQTLQSRFRYSTPSLNHVGALLEFNGVSEIGGAHHNPGLNISPAKLNFAEIDDPKGTQINRAFFSYQGFDDTLLILGRQYIDLDNGRFISSYNFRQTPNTFDAFSFTNHSVAELELFYSYIWRYNTPFSASTDRAGAHQQSSHLFNATYKGFPYGQVVGYTYFMSDKDLGSNSADTFGLRYSDIRHWDRFKLDYSAEYAAQHSRHNAPLTYRSRYYALTLGGELSEVGTFDKMRLNAGYEVLQGRQEATGKAFRTSFGDFYNFLGNANQVSSLNSGVEDASLGASTTVHGYSPRVTYHRFVPYSGNGHLGYEWDLALEKNFLDHYTAGIAWADFKGNAENGTYDTRRLWLSATAAF